LIGSQATYGAAATTKAAPVIRSGLMSISHSEFRIPTLQWAWVEFSCGRCAASLRYA